MPMFVSGGFFSQKKDLYPPYIKKEGGANTTNLSAGAKNQKDVRITIT